MRDFMCELLPVLAFLSGTLLGGLIISLFNREQRRHLEAQYKNASNANMALESQLLSKDRLESDLSRTNSELEQLREQIIFSQSQILAKEKVLLKENEGLKKEINKLKSYDFKPKTNYVNEYQLFLQDLEKSIKKAKKKSFKSVAEDPPKKKKKKEEKPELKSKKRKKKKEKKKTKSKYDFYKQKFRGKSFDPATLGFNKSESTEDNQPKEKDLTYLYGITPQIQKLLNKHGIKSFTDLSLTKIAELKAILALEGGEMEKIDPLNWPIQARIAEKGQWEILEEYKSKMSSGK